MEGCGNATAMRTLRVRRPAALLLLPVLLLLLLATNARAQELVAAWEPVSGDGNLSLPGGLCGHSMAFHADTQRLFLFNGRGSGDALQSATWWISTREPREWQAGPANPSPREGAPTLVDGARNRILAYGGRAAGAGPNGSALVYDNFAVLSTALSSTWSLVAAGGGGGPQGRADAELVWLNESAGQAFLFGGFTQQGVAANDSWLLDVATLTFSPLALAPTSAAGPPASVGHITAVYGDRVVVWSGYTCAGAPFAMLSGGRNCFVSDIFWLNTTSREWNSVLMPPDDDGTWPSARAYAVGAVNGNKLWIFGGFYIDATVVWYYFNDLRTLNLDTLEWETADARGEPAPVMAGVGATVNSLRADGVSATQLWLYGGCAAASKYDSLVALTYEFEFGAGNLFAFGPGLQEAAAGEPLHFFVQAREVLNASLDSSGAPTWGPNITWAIGLELSAVLLGEVGCQVTHGEVTELGAGLYRVDAQVELGGSFLRAVVTLGNDDEAQAPGSPFLIPFAASVPRAAFTTASGAGVSTAVRGKQSVFEVHLADEFGNLLGRGGAASELEVEVAGQPLASELVSDLGNGRYRVTVPSVPQLASYELAVRVNGSHITGSPFRVATIAPLESTAPMHNAVTALGALGLALMAVFAALLIVSTRRKPQLETGPDAAWLIMVAGCALLMASLLVPDSPTTRATCSALFALLGSGFCLAVPIFGAKANAFTRAIKGSAALGTSGVAPSSLASSRPPPSPSRGAAPTPAAPSPRAAPPSGESGSNDPANAQQQPPQPPSSPTSTAATATTAGEATTALRAPSVVVTQTRRPVLARQLYGSTLLAIGAELVFLAAWLLAAPLRANTVTLRKNPLLSYDVCNGSGYGLWLSAQGALCGAALLYATTAVTRAKEIAGDVREVKASALAIYNLVITALLASPIGFFVRDAPATLYIARSILVFWTAVFTSAVVVVPLFRLSAFDAEDELERARDVAKSLHTNASRFPQSRAQRSHAASPAPSKPGTSHASGVAD